MMICSMTLEKRDRLAFITKDMYNKKGDDLNGHQEDVKWSDIKHEGD